MRILNDTKYISKRILDSCYLDVAADILKVFVPNCAALEQMLQRRVSVVNAPVCDDRLRFISIPFTRLQA